MLRVGVQSSVAVNHEEPLEDLKRLKEIGFSSIDFSLHSYLTNKDLYKTKKSPFFDKSEEELCDYFSALKNGCKETGIEIFQMHMPYPNYVPTASKKFNDYLREVMAVKSMKICDYLGCKYIVIHGFKLSRFLGSEELEWQETQKFLEFLAPFAAEHGITMCVENIYESAGSHIIEGPCCNAAKAVTRIDEMNDKYGAEVVGFCFDTGHANLVGIKFQEFIETLGPRLKVLHVHDNDGMADLHQVPFTFTRSRENSPSTDWDGFLKGLSAIGYDGVISFETSPVLKSFPPELREDALRLIYKIGCYFGEKVDER
jgi:sugar phosphate isomerase/epimerase